MRRGMPLSLRIAIFAAWMLATFAVCPALAALPAGCANPNDSALNQYCDSLPASGGQSPPRVGAAGVASLLPARVIGQIEHGRTARPVSARVRQNLLRLPAPAAAHGRPASAGGGAQPSFPLWLGIAMAALAVALIAAALIRRRRERAPTTPGGSPA